MTQPGSEQGVLASIQGLRSDPRFSSLFNAELVALAMWVLDVECSGLSRPRVVYAWVIASPPARSGWSFAKGKEISTGEPGTTCRLARMVLVSDPDTIFRIVSGLLSGERLAEVCAAASVESPDRLQNLCLGPSRAAIEAEYTFGPVRFLGSRTGTGGTPGNQMSSPSREHPAFCAKVVRLHKDKLFLAEGDTPMPAADEVAKQVLLYLQGETGLDFSGSDAARLGDLELLALPTTDRFENEYVRAETRKAGEGESVRVTHVDVTIRPGPLPAGTRVLVRCRIFVGNEVTTDECREGVVGGPVIGFPVVDEITRWLLTIWTFDQEGVARIWFEDEAVLIREIVMHMGVMGLSGRLDSDWTHALATKRAPLAKRVDKVRALQQVSYEISSGAGRRAPWELAEREAMNLARRLLPPASTARFFERGWAEAGRVGFVEWFIELTSDAAATDVLIVDPYFDADGVVDFLARARATQIRYAVLTNSQVSSKDDPPASALPPAERRNQRAERLRLACEGARDILSRLQFEIRDVRSKGVTRDQLFHDRYILVFGKEHGDREVKRGFNLSNSIQGATKHSPLLVTPIPVDVLDQVAGYVDRLVQADPAFVGDSETVTIASSQMFRRTAADDSSSIKVGDLLAELLGDADLRGLDADSVKPRLERHDGLSAGGHSFRFAPAFGEKLRAYVEGLLARNDADFATGWNLLGEWFARMAEGKEEARTVLRVIGAPLAARLERLLDAAPISEPPLGFRGLPLSEGISGHGHLFRGTFESVLENAGYMLQFRDRFYAFRGYGIRYAIRTLVDIAPERLVGVAERAWERVPESEKATDSNPSVRAALNLLGMVLDRLLDVHGDERILGALMGSKLALLRALAAQSVLPTPAKADVTWSLSLLKGLEPAEQLEALAESVSELRVEANRNDYREPASVRDLRMRIFEEIVHLWPTTIEDGSLKRLARRLGGPGEGAWAPSTTEELFRPLVAAGKLTWERVAGLWLGMLEERLNSMLSAGSGSPHGFYARNDVPLTEAAVLALSRSRKDVRQVWLERHIGLKASAMRVVSAPFSRSRNYSRWADASETLGWLGAIAGCVLLFSPETVDGEEREAWSSLREEIVAFLSHQEHRRDPGVTFLEKQVDQQLRERTGS